MWEWYCDLRLTPDQRRQHREQFARTWSKRDLLSNQRSLANYATMEKEWREILKLPAAEQSSRRNQIRRQWMDALRKSTDEEDRFLVAVYDAAYRPGGTKNPILVDGEPPLTRALLDQRFVFVEWLLDLRLTEEQRAEYQRLFIKVWKERDQARNKDLARGIEIWTEGAASWTSFHRNLGRALYLPRALMIGGSADANEADRWLVALYETAYKPGGPRNPILVEGEPALTQALVDRYGDYLECVFQLSLTGGLTPAQRQVLQEHLIKEWKRKGPAGREELLATLKKWAQVAPLGVKEWNSWRETVQPGLLAQLRAARDDAFSQWQLELYNKEQMLLQTALAAERARHEITMNAIRGIGASAGPPPGYREVYNLSTGRYEYRPQ
jgi:hypothetical protein